jgi:hypothetical protein
MKKLLIALAATCALLCLPGVASAGSTKDKGWTNYAGKTKEGSKISFAYRKGTIALLETSVPSSCGSAQGGNPSARMSTFDPPFSVVFKANGRESQVKVEKPWPTRYYTVTARKQGTKIAGKLRLSWSMLASNTFEGYHILTCVGTGNFSVKPVK